MSFLLGHDNVPSFRNPIFRFHWAGWESDTLTLQTQGWEIAAQQVPEYRSIRFAFRHPEAKVYGYSETIEYSFMEERHKIDQRDLCLTASLCSSLRIEMMGNTKEWGNFAAIDATPTMDFDREIRTIEDLVPFQPIAAEHELIVEPQDVNMMLDLILGQQKPGQAELREKGRKRERREARQEPRKVHAQIVSFAA